MQINLSIDLPTKQGPGLLALAEIIYSLQDEDSIIVGHEIIPQRYDKDILSFLASNSLPHLTRRDKVYTELLYTLDNARQIADCIQLPRITNAFTLHLPEKRPLADLTTPQICHLFFKDDFSWYKDNASKFRAVVFLSTEDRYSLQIISTALSYDELFGIMGSALAKYPVSCEACALKLKFA
jgi:hypothetical protein